MTADSIKGGATFDRSGRYRYRLWRQWDEALPAITLVMLNPSAADAVYNDQTISTCMRLARRFNFGSIEVVNLFAYCTSDPRQLKQARNPVGKHNDHYIWASAQKANSILIAWGNHGNLQSRHMEVLDMLVHLATPLYCLGVTKQGQPRHPLYLPGDAPMVPFL
jgi:hypothetical protein